MKACVGKLFGFLLEPVVIYFRADHPFVYVISDVNTGVVYFIGTYHG